MAGPDAGQTVMEEIPPDETPLATRVGDELAARIASEFFGVRRVGLRRIVGKGVVNQIFVAEAGDERIVVRLCDDIWALKQHEKEAWCIGQAAGLGIPGPEVFAVGTAEGGAAYMIESFVGAAAGDELPASAFRIWRKLGEYARAIHTVELEGFGIDLPDFTSGDARGGWLRYVDYNIESLNEQDELLRLGVLRPGQSAEVRLIFEELRRGREFRFGLNHGDLSLKNTIVDEAGTVFLLDWGSAAADIVPHRDLVEMLEMRTLKNDPDDAGVSAFLKGYGMTRGRYEALLPEIESIYLLRSFDLVRYAIDRRPDLVPFYAAQARRALAHKLARS